MIVFEYLPHIKTVVTFTLVTAVSKFDNYILIASEFEQNQQERTVACNALKNSSEEGKNNK